MSIGRLADGKASGQAFARRFCHQSVYAFNGLTASKITPSGGANINGDFVKELATITLTEWQ
jgi:hypothetical protein